MRKQIKVWVCPTPECSNYWASSSSHGVDLDQEPNYLSIMNRSQTRKREIVSYRAECPDCKQAGRGVVHRVKLLVVVDVPDSGDLKSTHAPPRRVDAVVVPTDPEHPLHAGPSGGGLIGPEPSDLPGYEPEPDNSDAT